MLIGIGLALTDRSRPAAEIAVAIEERGLESMWIGEHTHLPVGSVHNYTRGRYSGSGRQGHIPDLYKRMPDPYISLTTAAMVTTRLRIGTSIALPAEHNPLQLAKLIATLDQVSNGRFEFGVGFGWNRLETANNGIPFERRRAVAAEKIKAMKVLWTQETAAFDGEFVHFTESWSWPKPAQRPHPPILLGAKLTPLNIGHIVDWADGCIPAVAMESDALAEDLTALRERAGRAGRDPDALQITLSEQSTFMAGKKGLEAFRAHLPTKRRIEEYRGLEVKRLVVGVPADDRDFMLAALDHVAALHVPMADEKDK